MDRKPQPSVAPNPTQNYYEHHADLKKNSIIPFKAHSSNNLKKFVCNWHVNPEILFVYKGSASLRYGSENINIEQGTTVIINSESTHSLVSEEGVGLYVLIIDESFFLENGIDISKFSFERITRDPETAKLCIKAYNEYRTLTAEKDSLSAAKLRMVYLELIIHICSKHILKSRTSEIRRNSSEKYVKKAMTYISENYTDKITLDSIAKEIGINKSYFAREFKKYAGQTVHTYINTLRCTMADRNLSNGMNVTETALACGFETLSYFSRTYKKLRGVPPVTVKDNNH